MSKIKMENCFVCYADILGFKEISKEAFKNGTGNELLNKINRILSDEYDQLREDAKGFDRELFKIKVFSDNVVIGYPLIDEDYDHGEPEFGKIIMMFVPLMLAFAKQGLILRGGITYGLHYMNDDIVFGDAFLEAVEMDKKGGYPGIALSKGVGEIIKKQINFYGRPHFSPQYRVLLEFPDGQLYINYLNSIFDYFPEYGIDFESAKEHYKMISENLNKYQNDPQILEKYKRLAVYHDYVIEEFLNIHQITGQPPDDEIYALACIEAQKLKKYLLGVTGDTPKKIDGFLNK